jgi:hypothetical protein
MGSSIDGSIRQVIEPCCQVLGHADRAQSAPPHRDPDDEKMDSGDRGLPCICPSFQWDIMGAQACFDTVAAVSHCEVGIAQSALYPCREVPNDERLKARRESPSTSPDISRSSSPTPFQTTIAGSTCMH